MWEPVLQAAKRIWRSDRAMDSAFGINPFGWIVSFFWIFLARPKRRTEHRSRRIGGPVQRPTPKTVEILRNVPSERFADVGGMEEAKEQIRQLVLGHLNPGKVRALRLSQKRNPSVRPAWNREELLGEGDGR